MPSWELFERASKNYQDKVLPPKVTARVAVEAGITMGWERYAGSAGAVVAIDRFGASAPGATVMDKYGMKAAAVVSKAMGLLKR
jgi:transketolase